MSRRRNQIRHETIMSRSHVSFEETPNFPGSRFHLNYGIESATGTAVCFWNTFILFLIYNFGLR